LARHPRIAALKDASSTMARAQELLSACPPDFSVLAGEDATAIEWLGAGAHGFVSVTGNVAPRRMKQACEAGLRGDMAAARAIDAELQPLHRDLFVESSPIPVKWAVARMGLMGNGIRLPLVELSPAHHDTVLRAMQSAGVALEEQAA
jgi:4-hydroxy-tetrahydrodipicolinate synthase